MGSATEIIYRKKNLNHQSPLATNDRKPPKARFPRLCHLSPARSLKTSSTPSSLPLLRLSPLVALGRLESSSRAQARSLGRWTRARARRQRASLDKRHICIQTQIVA